MFKRKKQIDVNLESFTPIERVKTLRGRYIPAFIHNMSYFFTKLQVYEDGLVDAWEMIDLDLFSGKLNSGWVKTAIPDGENISIHHLGEWEVTDGKWDYDKESFFKHIKSVIKDLNPEMQNLHNCFGQTTKKINNVNTSILGMGNGKPYLEDGPEFMQKRIKGDDFSVFVQLNTQSFALANLCVFSNGAIQIFGIPETLTYTLPELESAINNKKIITKPEKGAAIMIYGLGSFVVGECNYAVNVDQLLLEVKENINRLQGKETASELCSKLFYQYCEDPTAELREQLKTAYESIPEHLRMYVLGDQDRKDIPVRMAIYGDDEIKKWSHYVLAEELGEDLPSIEMPSAKD